MIADLEALDATAAVLVARARAAGVRLFFRAQARSLRSIVVREGKPESSSVSTSAGNGVQVVTEEGRTALASRDDLASERSLELFDRALRMASEGGRLGLCRSSLAALEPARDRVVPGGVRAFDTLRLDEVGQRLVELEAEIRRRVERVHLRLSFRADLDAWRIFRDDGTDVTFVMPRCTLSLRATSAAEGDRHGVSATVFSPRPDVAWDPDATRTFLMRGETAARLARELPEAPNHPSGSFPLVIDYALAKGLAHEAFGHASEADGFRSSVLATDGRFRRGDEVGAKHVSIVDEPVPDDHAWQPYSANGLPRRRVRIVDHGLLDEALSDPWSAEAGGVPLTGSARAESFHQAPQPRMSNIRIEVDTPLPAPGAFEEYGPAEVRDLLERAGVFRRHPRVSFLSGYNGGQVNSTSGDFVFNCKAIYVLGPEGIALHRPAIFSGSMFGALHAVREAFGPLKLDAIGHCGKWGQSVPSSGGSHYFLVLDPDPTVRLGGT
jgi:TldD protein